MNFETHLIVQPLISKQISLAKKWQNLKSTLKNLDSNRKNLLDIFENLFGQHLSTMITMAALHQIQNAMRKIYQNVVEIDTAVTELRKVSEYAGESLEEYMGRAAKASSEVRRIYK